MFPSLFFFLVCCFLFLVFASAGPASSCASGSSDPCCNYGSFYSGANVDWPLIKSKLICNGCAICGESSSLNTAQAATTQNNIGTFGTKFDQYQCWNGYISSGGGTAIEFLDLNQFVCNVKGAACDVNFYIPYTASCSAQFNYKTTTIAAGVVGGFFLLLSMVLLFILFMKQQNKRTSNIEIVKV